MNFATLVFRNVTVKWWRSLTLGVLIFAVGLVMVLFSSLTEAVKDKVDKVILQGITGHLQIRSDQSMEGDMVEQYQKGWDALKPLSPAVTDKISALLDREFPETHSTHLVRQGAFLQQGGKREETMLIGIDPRLSSYREAFLLQSGRYLSPGASDEILLTLEQARTFGVSVGDRIRIATKNRFGLNASVDLKVAGIGNFIMLSLFSYKACYLHADAVQDLVRYNKGEVTDLILFLPHPRHTEETIRRLARGLERESISYTITRDEKLASSDLKVKDLSFGTEEKTEKVKISDFKEMGQVFRSTGEIMFVTLNILVFFLLVIVGILIINLVSMMGMERYREIGTLRAIGFGRLRLIFLFLLEILMISLCAGCGGILTGIGLILFLGRAGISSPIPAMDFIMGRNLVLEPAPGVVASGLVIIMLFSLAASFYPAYKATSIEPARALRSL